MVAYPRVVQVPLRALPTVVLSCPTSFPHCRLASDRSITPTPMTHVATCLSCASPCARHHCSTVPHVIPALSTYLSVRSPWFSKAALRVVSLQAIVRPRQCRAMPSARRAPLRAFSTVAPLCPMSCPRRRLAGRCSIAPPQAPLDAIILKPGCAIKPMALRQDRCRPTPSRRAPTDANACDCVLLSTC